MYPPPPFLKSEVHRRVKLKVTLEQALEKMDPFFNTGAAPHFWCLRPLNEMAVFLAMVYPERAA